MTEQRRRGHQKGRVWREDSAAPLRQGGWRAPLAVQLCSVEPGPPAAPPAHSGDTLGSAPTGKVHQGWLQDTRAGQKGRTGAQSKALAEQRLLQTLSRAEAGEQ
ncbi:hypothetical protein H1C71_041769 [Ictidomys tridecemlineatus]|nr:hypothetical protein H1C71_041769 [Ictidomys tridecemlineatus]